MKLTAECPLQQKSRDEHDDLVYDAMSMIQQSLQRSTLDSNTGDTLGDSCYTP
jgi:hypothetical protein